MSEVRFKRIEILDASSRLRKWIESNKKLPGFTYFRDKTIQIKDQDMLYLMTSAIVQIQYGQNEDILYRNFSPATNPVDDIYKGKIPQLEYLKIAKDVRDYMEKESRAPDYAYKTSLGDHLGFKNLVYMSSMVLDWNLKSGMLADWADMPGKPSPSFTTWYNSMIGAGYANYDNDVYNSEEEEYNIAHHIAMNCSDYSQKAAQKAKELGYEVRYVHVICKSGKGHIYIQVKGREFNNWTNVDVAAAASVGSKYPIGQVWCPDGDAWISNESWLLVDDGEW